MSVPPIGFSSGTLPQAGARELGRAVLAAGGTGVDLRIGKGHGWERGGVRAGLDEIQAAGAEVFFFGLGWRLGDPDGWPTGTADGKLPPAGWPVKVFCAADPDPVLVAEQLAVAAAAGLDPWVETHAGGPDVRGLLELAKRSGVGVVLDLLGLAEIGGASTAQLRALAPFIRAAQVKGVHLAGQGIRHRPLVREDLAGLLSVLPLAPLRAVTVESRAGTHDSDLAVLAGAMRAAVPKSVIPTPSQEWP